MNTLFVVAMVPPVQPLLFNIVATAILLYFAFLPSYFVALVRFWRSPYLWIVPCLLASIILVLATQASLAERRSRLHEGELAWLDSFLVQDMVRSALAGTMLGVVGATFTWGSCWIMKRARGRIF